MDSNRFGLLKRIVTDALRKPPGERQAYLEKACGDDLELRREAESLLRDPATADQRILTGMGAELAESFRAATTKSPEMIGPYRVLERLGEGGMGVVYLAEQEQPIRRTVALKLIRSGLDSRRIVARFEAERQALALMNHPNIAQVFGGGVDEDGAPYFAMEYVDGESILRYCQRIDASVDDRIALFLQVCDGVEHAHQKGILHRDLKPSNVLVQSGDGGAPKIIDFGIAKAMQDPLTDSSYSTRMGALIGTPEYMSPEQADFGALDVDTRSDVFALGLLLYELLVGRHALPAGLLERGNPDEIREQIRRAEFVLPSRRAGLHGLRARSQRLRGDLDWIVMKAVARDRERRYGSPHQLAEDLRRHLAHEAVLAGPPNVGYRLRKFVRRNVLGVSLSGAMLLFLCVFAVGMAIQSRRVERERQSAQRASEFLAEMLAGADPQEMGFLLDRQLREQIADPRIEELLPGVNFTSIARALLEERLLSPAGEAVHQQIESDPVLAVRLLQTLGQTYGELGIGQRAAEELVAALELSQKQYGPEHLRTRGIETDLAEVYLNLGEYERGEALLREVLSAYERALGPTHERVLEARSHLATAVFLQGRYEESEALHEEALEGRRRIGDEDSDDALSALNDLGNVYLKQGRFAEAESVHTRVLEARRRKLGDDHRDTISSRNNLAYALALLGRTDRAAAQFEEVLLARRGLLGEEHPLTMRAANNLAIAYRELGRLDEASELAAEVLASRRRFLGPAHRGTLSTMGALAAIELHRGEYSRAEELLRGVYRGRAGVLGPEHPETLQSRSWLAEAIAAQGRHSQAAALLDSVLIVEREVLRPNHSNLLATLRRAVEARAAQGEMQLARRLGEELIEGCAALVAEQPKNHRAINDLARQLARCPVPELRDPPRALELAMEIVAASERRDPRYLDGLALALHANGRGEEAIATLQEAIRLLHPRAHRDEYDAHLAEFEDALER